jgi:hypothetical protein
MSRAEIAIEPGDIDRVQVVPVADDYWHSLLVIVGTDARITLQVPRRDLGVIERACHEARLIEEQRQRAEDATSEAAA